MFQYAIQIHLGPETPNFWYYSQVMPRSTVPQKQNYVSNMLTWVEFSPMGWGWYCLKGQICYKYLFKYLNYFE